MRTGATIAILLAVILLAGCAGYAPSPESAPVMVHLAPIINESTAPQIIATVSRNLRERLLHDRQWQVSARKDADAVLTIRVRNLERRIVSRDPGDTGRPLSYLERLRIQLEWDSPLPAPWGPEEEVFFDIESLIYSQPGLIQSESVAYAELADQVAAEIVELLNRSFYPASR